MSIGTKFRAYLPKERIRGLWETEDGLAFVQRQRIENGLWESPGPEPIGLYHVVVHAASCQLTATHNGRVRYTGYLPANTIQFSRPDEEVHCKGRGSIRFLTVSFTPEFLVGHLDSLFVDSDVDLYGVRSTVDVGLAHLAHTYEDISARGMPVTQLYFDIIRQAMLDRIVFRHASRPIRRGLSETLVPARAGRVIDYIEAHLTSDLQLAELSTVAGISRSHFARAFRNTIGIPPHAFVLQRRLARSVELLTHRKLPMREVAERCGFADHAHLTRAFKAKFGYPPSLISLHWSRRSRFDCRTFASAPGGPNTKC
jgi:AraC family transcriptional regulator